MLTTPTMQELLEAGVHFGHKVSRGHPKMMPYIFSAKDGVHIIDLSKTEEKLKEAAEAAYKIGQEGKVLLAVGTKKQARDITQSLAKEVGASYLTQRWVGGLLTNFEEIKKNLKKLNQLREQQTKGELSRYTKREQLLIARKIEKFVKIFGGVADLEAIPGALFIIDGVSDYTAIKEARKMNITILGICDTNADPNWFDYPVPANDDGIKSIKLITDTVLHAYGKGRQEAKEIIAGNAKTEGEKDKDSAKSINPEVAEEAAAIEEEIEKKVVEESARKV